MKNWNVTADDRAKAHSRHGEDLQGKLDQAQAKLDRRSDILQSSQAGTAAHSAAWDRYVNSFASVDAAKKHCAKTSSTFKTDDSAPGGIGGF